MKRVTVFVGSARKQHTHRAALQLLKSLESLGGVEGEIVALSDYKVETCRGCRLCLDKGEEFCKFKDDRDVLIEKMMASDGVVFASPNYSFQVSAIMKIFLDRLAFVFHRPRFFGKTFTSIVVHGIYGGPKIVEYLDFVGFGLGFNVVKGSCITTREPIPEKVQRTNDGILAAHSRRFHQALSQSRYPVPTLFKLMAFRFGRTSIRLTLDDTWLDYRHYRDHGWFESEYFYPTRLNVFKKAAGRLFDYNASRGAKESQAARGTRHVGH